MRPCNISNQNKNLIFSDGSQISFINLYRPEVITPEFHLWACRPNLTARFDLQVSLLLIVVVVKLVFSILEVQKLISISLNGFTNPNIDLQVLKHI